ncbi:hypothetical protein [Burkholderia glumae]|uniref:hypothetical protein n=1 Tax=Burkholderia glumae TaxID=337 RepID=UPI00142EE438|nr:hypothetical protein [Burkholderia glumae]
MESAASELLPLAALVGYIARWQQSLGGFAQDHLANQRCGLLALVVGECSDQGVDVRTELTH